MQINNLIKANNELKFNMTDEKHLTVKLKDGEIFLYRGVSENIEGLNLTVFKEEPDLIISETELHFINEIINLMK